MHRSLGVGSWLFTFCMALLMTMQNSMGLQNMDEFAGTKDENIAASIKVLDEELNKNGVKYLFEVYEGTHINRIAERIKLKMLPFFSKNFSFVP
jgi:hypothetical protein